MTIYKYEVELRFTNTRTGESHTATSVQHAYTIGDAIYQAGYVGLSSGKDDKVDVIRVGPPLEDIRTQEQDLSRLVANAVGDALTKLTDPRYTSAVAISKPMLDKMRKPMIVDNHDRTIFETDDGRHWMVLTMRELLDLRESGDIQLLKLVNGEWCIEVFES